jgi:hypothetical protein
MVLHWQTASPERVGEVRKLVTAFATFLGKGTRQLGPFYCIPAAVSNATRLFGHDEFTQEVIRDQWYAEQQRDLEPDIRQQMTGAGFGIVETLKNRTEFNKFFDTDIFTCQGDHDPFNLSKANEAVEFVAKHVGLERPVVVSTWSPIIIKDGVTMQCCHMWLVLAYEATANCAIVHDSGDDNIKPVPISAEVQLPARKGTRTLNLGLRGRITHTDYSCMAIWKR